MMLQMITTDPPFLSLISVTLNNLKGLQKTQRSLLNQNHKNFEWIVIDGASTDGTQKWLEKEPEVGVNSCFICEKDDGLYDAMNKGLDQAEGNYILFLNAGDQLAEDDSLEKLAKNIDNANNPAFVYGDAYEETMQGDKIYKPARHVKKIASGMITHHQAMMYHRETIKDMRYDLSYRLAADYDFTARLLKENPEVFYCGFPICIFEAGGVSQKNAKAARAEEYKIRQNLELCSSLMNMAVNMRQIFAHALKTKAPHLYYKLRALF